MHTAFGHLLNVTVNVLSQYHNSNSKNLFFLVLFKCSLQMVCYFGGDTTEDAAYYTL